VGKSWLSREGRAGGWPLKAGEKGISRRTRGKRNELRGRPKVSRKKRKEERQQRNLSELSTGKRRKRRTKISERQKLECGHRQMARPGVQETISKKARIIGAVRQERKKQA